MYFISLALWIKTAALAIPGHGIISILYSIMSFSISLVCFKCVESNGENQILTSFHLDIIAVTDLVEVCVHVGRRPQIQFQLKSVNFHEAQKHRVIKRKIL